jgi:acyl carrier protein
MLPANTLAFAAALAVVIMLYVAYHLRLKRDLKRMLAGRQPVPANGFGPMYYTDPGKAEVGTFIVSKLEELSGYELTGVIPQDRIITDLHLDELDSLAAAEIVTEVEARFGVKITNTEAAATKTLDDFVELVSSKRRVQ